MISFSFFQLLPHSPTSVASMAKVLVSFSCYYLRDWSPIPTRVLVSFSCYPFPCRVIKNVTGFSFFQLLPVLENGTAIFYKVLVSFSCYNSATLLSLFREKF